MKKLINKKVSLLGKEFSVLAIVAVMMIGLASAALVSYISNTITGDVAVSSPIAIVGFTEDVTAFGGETKTLSATLVNQADANITGKIEIVITNTGITIDDFDSLTANIVETINSAIVFKSGDVDLTTVGGFIASIEDSVANTITITTTERTFEPTETWTADIDMGFKANALGNYTVAVTIVPMAFP